ncbi:MAG: nucleoside monophosphate kinase [Verrucomicrobia bacterium]|nr:nucleoside monophosphate kinase [Verrucomicrobiota bacterium]
MKKIIISLLLSLSSIAFSLEPIILLFGPPGSGKGTFSQLAKEKGYNHLSAGDLIRDEITKKTPFGLEVEEIVKRGDYVDPVVFCRKMKDQITVLSAEGKPLIIDGFGRTLNDMKVLVDTIFELQLNDDTLVLFFDAEDGICKERISGRLVCNDCHHVYSTKDQAFQVGDLCLSCGTGVLQERINDTLQVINKRMEDYRSNSEKNYKKSLDFFPGVFFDSGQESSVCIKFYQEILNQIKDHQGNAKTFVAKFDQK